VYKKSIKKRAQRNLSVQKKAKNLKKSLTKRPSSPLAEPERKEILGQVLRQSILLEGINKVLIEAARCETDEEVARTCLMVAQELTGSKFAFICERNSSGRFDTIAISDSGWDACRIPKDEALLKIKDTEMLGIERRPIEERRSMIFNDPTSDPDWRGLPKGHPPITCLLGVPLIQADRATGMICLANKESGYGLADQEEIEMISVAFVQVLQRKRAEMDLKASEKKYRSLVENALVGVYKTTLSGDFVFSNKALARMLEFDTPKEMMANTVLEIYKNKKDRAVLLEELSKKSRVSNFETELLTKTGKTKNAILSATLEDGVISGMVRDVTEHKRIERELQATLKVLNQTLAATTQAINMIVERRDPYTAGHQKRVADLSHAIASEMNLPGDVVDGIRIAGLLHDLGKVFAPSEILSKPGKISEYEFTLIKMHPRIAYDILKTIEFPWPIADIILQHHERMDGSGYPQGLSDDNILLEARILAVADVVEAMLSHRPYRPAYKLEAVLDEISRKSSILYDPRIVDVCLKLFKEKTFIFQE